MGSRHSKGLVVFFLDEKSSVPTKVSNSFNLTRVVVNSVMGLCTEIRGPRTHARNHLTG